MRAAVDRAVPPELAGLRVDRVVSRLGGVSRAEAARLVAGGLVRLAGEVTVDRARAVVAGQRLEVEVPGEALGPPPVPEGPGPAIVHEDEHLLVIDKPPGLVTHPGAGHRQGTLSQWLVVAYPELAGVGPPERPGIVHRLDRDTSGLMVVVRTTEAYEALVTQLAAHEVERRYLALVWGHPEPPRGVVDAPIGRSQRDRTRMAVVVGGKPARTRYRVRDRFQGPGELALVECELETGRTHQVRVHLAALGHPVVGDERYGAGRRSLGEPRFFLHAHGLALVHPSTGERLAFERNLPADLAAVLDRLSAGS